MIPAMLLGSSHKKPITLALLGSSMLQLDSMPHNLSRLQILQTLSQLPGQYVIFVHYRSDHNPHQEWVYNDANIDESKIVWAREIDPVEDHRLIEYFSNRMVLLLDADAQPPKLSPYPSTPN